MDPSELEKHLRLVKKPDLKSYLAPTPLETVGMALERKIRWAKGDFSDLAEQQESAFILTHQASLRALAAIPDMDEDEDEWVEATSAGQEYRAQPKSHLKAAPTSTGPSSSTAHKESDEDTGDEPTPLPGLDRILATPRPLSPRVMAPQPTERPTQTEQPAFFYPDTPLHESDPNDETLIIPEGSPRIGSTAEYVNVNPRSADKAKFAIQEPEIDTEDSPATPHSPILPASTKQPRDDILSGLRESGRLTAAQRMIPRAASKLRPYLLAALVLAIIPLALLITNRFGGASANITNPDGANASAPRASDAISTTASETVSEPSNEEGSADGTTDALNGPAATDFESDTNSEPSATLDQISAPPEPTDEGSTDGGVEEDGADETPPSDAPQDTESPKNESEEPQDAVADASSAPPDDKEAPDEPSESTQTEESEAPAEPLSETPKDESEGTEEEEGSKGLVMYSSTTDLNRTNTQLPNLKGAWKCKISDSACYMSVTSQTGDRVSATISIEEEDGSWTEIQLQGRYNTTLNMLRLDQVSGGRAVFKGEINGKQLHGSATIHAGAARVTWTASR